MTARSDSPAARLIGQALPVLPLLVVTGGAGFGQILYGIDRPGYSPVEWSDPQRLAVAIGVACGLEAIAVYVGWHAHDALLTPGGAATAARLRRASYLIAAGIAAINYSHFAGPGGAPTPAAVAFAGFSASGPWLWGLHTRRAQRVQLTRDGQLDTSGATFSAERWRAFPFRTWAARRWSIDFGISDPQAAWEDYRAARAASVESRSTATPPARLPRIVVWLAGRRTATVPNAGTGELSAAGETGHRGPTLPDRRSAVDTSSMAAICSDLRAIADEVGRPLTQDEVRQMYGIGAGKAGEARRALGWYPRAVDQSTDSDRPGRPDRQLIGAGS